MKLKMLLSTNFSIFKKISYVFFIIIIILSSYSADAFVDEDRISTAKSVAYYLIGKMYDFQGLPNRAILEYEKAAQFDEASYLIHLRLGIDYARLNMLEESKKELFLVNKLNPEDLESHYLLALIYSSEKEYNKAAQEYEFILKEFSKAEPQNIQIYGYLGQLYYSQRKYDQAIAQFEKILEFETKNADVMYLLGSLYLEIDNKEKAIDILKKSIDIDPEHDGSLNTLGYIYAEESTNLDEAISLIKRALDLYPDNGAYLDSLGWAYYKKKMYKEALEVLKKANIILEDPVIYKHLGDVYYSMSNMEDAVKNWELSIELQPEQEELIRKINKVKNVQASK